MDSKPGLGSTPLEAAHSCNNPSLTFEGLVRGLLEKDFTVHAALGSSPEQAAEMTALPSAEKRLELMRRDLLGYTSLADAIEECSAVFLTIPPCESLNGLLDYPAEVVNAKVRGTLNVLEAGASTASVKLLVLTSSASAVTQQYHNLTGTEKSIDERCWSNVDLSWKIKAWSALAKTVAEKAAWSLAQDRGVKLVVMNPATVVSPAGGTTDFNVGSDTLFRTLLRVSDSRQWGHGFCSRTYYCSFLSRILRLLM